MSSLCKETYAVAASGIDFQATDTCARMELYSPDAPGSHFLVVASLCDDCFGIPAAIRDGSQGVAN